MCSMSQFNTITFTNNRVYRGYCAKCAALWETAFGNCTEEDVLVAFGLASEETAGLISGPGGARSWLCHILSNLTMLTVLHDNRPIAIIAFFGMPRRIEWISNTSRISGCLYISLCTSDAFPAALFEYVMRKNTEFLDSNSASTNPQMCLHLSKRGVNECVGAMLELHLCAKQIQIFSDWGNLEWKWVQRFSEDAWLTCRLRAFLL